MESGNQNDFGAQNGVISKKGVLYNFKFLGRQDLKSGKASALILWQENKPEVLNAPKIDD
jgi:hypothetical protein